MISSLKSDGSFDVPYDYLTKGQNAHMNTRTVSGNMTTSIRFVRNYDRSTSNGQVNLCLSILLFACNKHAVVPYRI